ncbi:MAG: hypothetical protein U5L76_02950 [Patescibacteria group bacterium]|nr:hypothetical protein [Patescibacteria group bacterium]
MSLKKYLLFMGISTVICWLSFLSVIFNISPESGFLAFLLFYISLFLSLLGTFFIIGFLIRALINKKVPLFRHLNISFRQSILFTVLIIGSLALQASNLLRWWNLLFFLLFLIILEFFFSIKRIPYGR